MFNSEQASKVVEAVRSGKSLRKACEAIQLPHTTFLEWTKADGALADQYARARDEGLEVWAEEILEISDECKDPNKARVQVDARKWLLSKMLPKKYGDKLDLSSSEGLTINVIKRTDAGKE